AVFLLNEEDARYAAEVLGVAPERLAVLPNGLAAELLDLPESGDPERFFSLLFLGAWTAAKGADLLPAIVHRLFRADPRFRLTVAGAGGPPERVLADFFPQ